MYVKGFSKPTIEYDGDVWKIITVGPEVGGLTGVHLQSTTRKCRLPYATVALIETDLVKRCIWRFAASP